MITTAAYFCGEISPESSITELKEICKDFNVEITNNTHNKRSILNVVEFHHSGSYNLSNIIHKLIKYCYGNTCFFVENILTEL